MQLDRDGAQHFPAAFAAAEVAALEDLFPAVPEDRPGARLGALSGLVARVRPAEAVARRVLGAAARIVGAKLFDKTAALNWALAWHQDRTIPVEARREVPGFGEWTVKAGILHCVPPFAILERTLTLRIHLDPVDDANGPLRVSPGTHRLGRIAEPDIADAVARHGSRLCLAAPGDIWAYATPILHASDRAARPGRRRVLQLLYSAEPLPRPLAWSGL